MSYDISLEQRAARPLAVVRRKAKMQELSKVVPEACGAVWNVVRSQNLQGAGRHVAVYFDSEMNIEVGVQLDGPFAGFGEVVPSSTPAGLVATATHFGPYGGLGAAHEAIHRWCEVHGHELLRPCWEVYGHWKDEWNRDPSLITTEVCYLVKPPTSQS